MLLFNLEVFILFSILLYQGDADLHKTFRPRNNFTLCQTLRVKYAISPLSFPLSV